MEGDLSGMGDTAQMGCGPQRGLGMDWTGVRTNLRLAQQHPTKPAGPQWGWKMGEFREARFPCAPQPGHPSPGTGRGVLETPEVEEVLWYPASWEREV